MQTDRDHYLDNLSPPELLLYVARGGKLVTKLMHLHYAKALAGLSLDYVPTPADLTRLIAEGTPKKRSKPPQPLVYRRESAKEKRKRLAQVPIAAERRTA